MTQTATATEDTLRQAIAHYHAGQREKAASACRAIIAHNPFHADAWHVLGLAELGLGRTDAALDSLAQAIRAAPETAAYHASRGQALKAAGRLAEAIEAHQEAIRLQPATAGIHYNAGNTLLAAGRDQDAADSFALAIRLRPDWPDAHNNLGHALGRLGRGEDALAAFRQAAALAPQIPELRFNIAEAAAKLGRHDEAITAYAETLRLAPSHSLARFGLARSLVAVGRLETVVACWEAAVQADPTDAEALNHLTTALARVGRFQEAERHARRVLQMSPAWAGAPTNLAHVLEMQGNIAEAIPQYRQALALDPDFPAASFGLSTALFRAGQFPEAWAAYETRWAAHSMTRRFATPQWTGETLGDQTLLLHWEQGLGDSAFLARFIPLAAQRARVIVLIQPALRRLIGTVAGVAAVFDDESALPPWHAHCPLGSLPQALGITRDTIPANIPYVRADPAATAAWRARLAALPGRRVGVIWAGNPGFTGDNLRSLPPAALAPLIGLPGLSFVSLQKGDVGAAPSGLLAADWTDELSDFADTAALMTALDLILTVDTSSAHVAGALGRPTWLMNRFNTDWRWTEEGGAEAWYPTIRQFRQPRPADWAPVLAAVRAALVAWVSK
jgi:tetratricopeptide (TPR) repeat protein